MNTRSYSKTFGRQTENFLEVAASRRLQRYLQYLLFLYARELDVASPLYHKDLMNQLEYLMDFLYAMEREQKRKVKSR